MEKRLRRLVCAAGWLGIAAFVCGAAVLIALICSTSMEDLAAVSSSPSGGQAPDYGAALVGITMVFFAVMVFGLLCAGGIVSLCRGVVLLRGVHRVQKGADIQQARLRRRTVGSLVADAVVLGIDGAAVFGAVSLLFPLWQAAERAAVIAIGAAFCACLAAAVVLQALALARFGRAETGLSVPQSASCA